MRKTARSIVNKSSAMTEAGAVGLIVLICLAVASTGGPILNGDEARFAQASREMSVNRAWVVPTFAGQPRYDKPILIYWATTASFRLLGITPFSARLPSVLAGAFCAALLAWSARRRWGPGSGLAAGLCLAASPIFFFEGQACTADALNMMWTLAAMLALEQILTNRPSRAANAVLWAATGAAVLTKGPVAPLFIASTLIAMWALDRRWRLFDGLAAVLIVTAGVIVTGPIVLIVPAFAATASCLKQQNFRRIIDPIQMSWGVLLFLLITLPWAIKAWKATDGTYFAVAVGRHVLERGRVALEGHSGFPGFFIVTAIILCFPWLAAALIACKNAWLNRRGASDQLFLLAWAVGPLLTLETVQTKLVHYWLPSYPALILLAIGLVWNRSEHRLVTGRQFAGLLTVHLLGGFVVAAIPIIPTLMFDLRNLTIPAISLFGLLLVFTIAGASMVTRDPRGSLLVTSGGLLIFLTILLGPFLSGLSESTTGTRATTLALGHIANGHPVALYGLRDEEMLFSLPLNTQICRSRADVQAAIQRNRDTVFCARNRDFLRDFPTADDGRFAVVDSAEGLDLGRGRRAEAVCFKLARRVDRESKGSVRGGMTADDIVRLEEHR